MGSRDTVAWMGGEGGGWMDGWMEGEGEKGRSTGLKEKEASKS